jgi:adenylate cyclase
MNWLYRVVKMEDRMEIERQFLIRQLPPLPDDFEVLTQGYLAFFPEIRIRSIDSRKFFLTVKRGAGLVREEWETEITQEEYRNLSHHLEHGTMMIQKRRYHLQLSQGDIAELFIHQGFLAGFSYVEVEFSSTEAAACFVPPQWFGIEVTKNENFSYAALARESDARKFIARLRQNLEKI